MPKSATEFFITVAQKDIGGTTQEQEQLIEKHYSHYPTVFLIRELHASGEKHLHVYLKGTLNRGDNLKRMLWNLLYPDVPIDKESEEWKRRIVVKTVANRYNVFTYMKKALDTGAAIIECRGIEWKDISENLAASELEWKMKKSLTSQKTVSYTSVPALMNVFYKETMLKIDPTIDEEPRAIFISLMESGQYLLFQHIPKLRGIIAQYRLLYMHDREHMEEYIENCLNFN